MSQLSPSRPYMAAHIHKAGTTKAMPAIIIESKRLLTISLGSVQITDHLTIVVPLVILSLR